MCQRIPRYDEIRNVYCMDDDAHTEFTRISDCFDSYPLSEEENEVTVEKRDNENADMIASDAEASTESVVTATKATSGLSTVTTSVQAPSTTDGTVETKIQTQTVSDIPPTPTAPVASTPSTPSSRPHQQSYLCRHNDHLCPVKRCTFCHIYTPPRAYHCRFCDVYQLSLSLTPSCVRNFDHHCPWVSNCVGLRNHKYFMWFLITSELCCLFGIGELAYFFTSLLIVMLKEVFLEVDFYQ